MDAEKTNLGGDKDPVKSAIGKKIQKIRRSMKLNQTEFGHLVDASQSAVSAWENGQPTLDAVLVVARLRGMKPEELFPDPPDTVKAGVGLALRRLLHQMEEIAEEYDALDSLTGELEHRPATGNGDRAKGRQGGGSATSDGRSDDDDPDP